jgi:hypothetical protein
MRHVYCTYCMCTYCMCTYCMCTSCPAHLRPTAVLVPMSISRIYSSGYLAYRISYHITKSYEGMCTACPRPPAPRCRPAPSAPQPQPAPSSAHAPGRPGHWPGQPLQQGAGGARPESVDTLRTWRQAKLHLCHATVVLVGTGLVQGCERLTHHNWALPTRIQIGRQQPRWARCYAALVSRSKCSPS